MTESNNRFSHAPVSQLVGFRVLLAEDGIAEVELNCDQRHHNPMGRVHGGIISALADAAMGIAFGSTLFDEQDFSTIEMKVNFVRPVQSGRVVAKAKVVERGLRIGFTDCEIVDSKGKRVATGTSTCTVIGG